MNKPAKLWEILSAIGPILIGLATWMWNIATRQVAQEERLKANEQAVQQIQTEYKADIKEIKAAMQAILIRLGPEKYIIKK